MAYRGKEERFNDFSGGLVSNKPITELELNEASTLDNLIIYPKGQGFRSRFGDTEFNSSAMNSGANLQGLSYYKKINLDQFLVAVCGTKVFSSTNSLGGVMTDITGALTITANQNNIWDLLTFNDNLIAFGGSPISPDAPFRWTGSGNAAALAGTPPSAYGAFQVNNRIFAFRTAANPSRIQWSILGNEADWTGVGSGSSDVWTSDNDSLTAAAILNTNTVLLFKQNSIHQMQIGNLVSGAFPIYPLFQGVGCAGKHALVVVDGLVYFITAQGKMKITDGDTITDVKNFPKLADIDDKWNTVNTARLEYIQGIRKTGKDYDHIIWLVSYGVAQSTNNYAFIWDLTNKCWLQNTTGYAANVLAKTTLGTLYSGNYNGKVYLKDSSSSTVTDASNSSALIDANWTSGWIHSGKFETIKQPRRLNFSFDTNTAGNIRISYGFDFAGLNTEKTISQAQSGSLWNSINWDEFNWPQEGFNMSRIRVSGRGNFFQYKIASPTESYSFRIHGFTMSGKEYGQKEISAR